MVGRMKYYGIFMIAYFVAALLYLVYLLISGLIYERKTYKEIERSRDEWRKFDEQRKQRDQRRARIMTMTQEERMKLCGFCKELFELNEKTYNGSITEAENVRYDEIKEEVDVIEQVPVRMCYTDIKRTHDERGG